MDPRFAHVDDWIFDLDNTLYPASARLFDLIDARMSAYVARILDCVPGDLDLDPALPDKTLYELRARGADDTLEGTRAFARERLAAELGVAITPKMVEGPALILRLDQVFLKPPRDGMGTNWHQDNAYFKISDPLKGTAMWIAVHDATAELRYLVVPMRPKGTEGWSEERLAGTVTRDCMIGVALPRAG